MIRASTVAILLLTATCATAPVTARPSRTSIATAKAGIDKTLANVNRLLARGTNAREVADMLYADDLQIAIEGERPFWRNLPSFLPKLEEYVTQPCTLAAIDPIRASGDLAVAFVSEHCPATKAGAEDENYRMLYVFRSTPRGWRVTMEMAIAGRF